MHFVNDDFTPDLGNLYVVDTSGGDITCTMPDISSADDDNNIYILNFGGHNINYVGFDETQLLNGNSTAQNSVLMSSDIWWSGSANWYRFA